VSVDETRTRFLAAIAAQIPPDRVIEVHLFGGIRQGGMESGVAVIAVDPDPPEATALAEPEPFTAIDVSKPVGAPAGADDSSDDEVGGDESSYASGDDEDAENPVVGLPVLSEAEGSPDAARGVDSAKDLLFVPELAPDAGEQPDVVSPEEPTAPPAPPRRYIVYTARYRYTLKGPDRGKWESSVTEEADAPLVTVDAVVRGVSRRSGEADETVRLSGDEFRASLPEVAARR
jgi:hypothetical protein